MEGTPLPALALQRADRPLSWGRRGQTVLGAAEDLLLLSPLPQVSSKGGNDRTPSKYRVPLEP